MAFRNATSRGSRGSKASTSEGRGIYRNSADGFRKSAEVQEEAKRRRDAAASGVHEPMRFWLPPGESTQCIIVDDEPSFFRLEHNMKDPRTGKWTKYSGCVSEFDHCPICEHLGKDAYYALYLTVIDLTEYTNSKGEKVDASRKLLVVKSVQHKKIQRLLERAERDGRTMRGMLLEFTRDGDKDSAIGNEIEFIEYVEEDEMREYVREYTDRDKKKHVDKMYEVFDYDAIFPEADPDELRRMVGADPVPGSRAHRARELGADHEASETGRKTKRGSVDEDDDQPWEDAEVSSAQRPAFRRSRPTDSGTKTYDDDDDIPQRPRRDSQNSPYKIKYRRR